MPFPQFEISDFPRQTPISALKSCYQIVANGSFIEHRDELALAAANVVLYAYGLTSKPLMGDAKPIETDEEFCTVAGHAFAVADSPTAGAMSGAIPWVPLAVFLLKLLLKVS